MFVLKGAMPMKNRLLKELYDCFYIPPELPAPRQEVEDCHKALVDVLEKTERRLVLQIIDAKDRIVEDTSIDSFISGFELVWGLSMKLNNQKTSALLPAGSGGRALVSYSRRRMKKYITAAAIAACPCPVCRCVAAGRNGQGKNTHAIPNAYRERPASTVAKLQTEVEPVPPAEKEKIEIPRQEPPKKAPPEPGPTPIETSVAPEVQATPEAELAVESAPEPSPAQTPIAPQSGDMVYVPGFGWIESQGPNHVEYAEDIYENGNKVGIMG